MTIHSAATAAPEALPIIDCDIHPSASPDHPIDKYFPKQYAEAMRQGMGSAPGHGYANPFGVERRDATAKEPKDVARDLLDKYNIQYAVLQPPGMSASLTSNIDVGGAVAHAWNEWQIAEWLEGDSRFLGSVCINTNDPKRAAQEIREMGKHRQMVQVNTTGEAADLYGHRRYFPIFEACEEMRLPFALHPGREGSLRSSTPIGRPSGYFEWHSGLPLTFQAHLISMVTEGAFETFPNLKLVLVEGGVAWLAHTMWRLDKNFKALRSTTPWLRRTPGEMIRAQVRLTTQPLEEPTDSNQLLQIFEMIHARETVCFASDFPHWDFDDPRHVLPKNADAELRRRIFYENAAELYGLPPLTDAQKGAA